ncbi:unnamed protein product [Tetraodon nigroviridis]|uniref:(spotted green pufferfish) hypothetical protein n=1 Tax=Tetraodon nigroviridis TaxID=99883 RepID=Q4S0C6_TETNG|nr:unnamed protein product [Tetraodon nigroviridis]
MQDPASEQSCNIKGPEQTSAPQPERESTSLG